MRRLKNHEIEILKKILSSNNSLNSILDEVISGADSYLVEEMNDGGMGSLKFASNEKDRKLGKTIGEIELQDADETPVLISLNLDSKGNLFELDVWKVDFSPVIKLNLE